MATAARPNVCISFKESIHPVVSDRHSRRYISSWLLRFCRRSPDDRFRSKHVAFQNNNTFCARGIICTPVDGRYQCIICTTNTMACKALSASCQTLWGHKSTQFSEAPLGARVVGYSTRAAMVTWTQTADDYYYFKFTFAYLLGQSGGGLPLSPHLDNRSQRYTHWCDLL